MPKIFLSYRRQDSEVHVGRIYDKLVSRFPSENVFLDVDSMIVGIDFRTLLAEAVGACDVLVAVIGDGWVDAADERGHRRLDNPADFVRIEIETALARGIPIIPLVLGMRGMPRPAELPESLQPLAFRHGEFVRLTPRDFHTDMDRLVRGLEKLAAHIEQKRYSEATPQEGQTRPSVNPDPAARVIVPRNLSALTPPPLLVTPFDAAAARRGQEEWAEHLRRTGIPGAQVEIVNSFGMRLTLIPPGEYLRGWPDSDEKPQHRVKITNAFYLGQQEVTQGNWKAVMGTEPWKGEGYVKEGPDYPATYVSWDDAQNFVTNLSQKDGRTYRLPTEAEWEYAARGGKSTQYSFGEDEANLGDFAWFNKNAYEIGEKYAHVVGLKKPNPFGLFDMHGNVWEWCQDWYDAKHAGTTVEDPKRPSVKGLTRVMRGGGWDSTPRVCRSAYRSWNAPYSRHDSLGFRVLTVQSSR